ncbi:hypothetical protein WOA01_04145 [Methylocystis sp. IM2]|uniref:hypothetical protein n=1 Tax=unclassified Methylocystis TaxID=2625913 RepID=UPI0030F88DFE
MTAAEQRSCSENWMRKCIAAATPDRERLNFRFSDAPFTKICLGYLSNDFHDHATALLLVEMLEAQDRSLFELTPIPTAKTMARRCGHGCGEPSIASATSARFRTSRRRRRFTPTASKF